jgi:3-phosphoshikimate 1-carboxyvinyltransferase
LNLTITPGPDDGLHGDIVLPGDKSLSHRASLLAAMAYGKSTIKNFLSSGVTSAMLEALSSLGVQWEVHGSTLTVAGQGLRGLTPPASALNCAGSATTLRMLAGAMAAAGIPAVLDGSAGLRRRPMGRIVEPLQQMGVDIQASNGCAPLTLRPCAYPLHALEYTLPVASAQVKSCLLLAALAADGTTILREPGPSRDHTERMLRSMGITVTSERHTQAGSLVYETCLTPPQPLSLSPLDITLPSDISTAAFFIVAALITPGSQVTIHNVGLNPGRTGLIDVLLAMGADIHISAQASCNGEPVGSLTVRHSHLHAAHISGEMVVRMIDEFPVFAIAAAYARGTSLVSDAQELRLKESDRISALCQELAMLGIQASETADGFSIQGGKPVGGGSVHPHGDHRLAMSLAIAGLASRAPVTVQEAEIVAESFPEFMVTLQSLGVELVIHESRTGEGKESHSGAGAGMHA